MSIESYHAAHPYCQACDLARKTAHIHHITTRGAGGKDDDGNLLALCVEHHAMAHAMGVRTFADMVPRVAEKIRQARWGK
jgi:Zn-dependent alcohol dehydrogenase